MAGRSRVAEPAFMFLFRSEGVKGVFWRIFGTPSGCNFGATAPRILHCNIIFLGLGKGALKFPANRENNRELFFSVRASNRPLAPPHYFALHHQGPAASGRTRHGGKREASTASGILRSAHSKSLGPIAPRVILIDRLTYVPVLFKKSQAEGSGTI
jgi:hypothetical protein